MDLLPAGLGGGPLDLLLLFILLVASCFDFLLQRLLLCEILCTCSAVVRSSTSRQHKTISPLRVRVVFADL
jgi:hypothetical protein